METVYFYGVTTQYVLSRVVVGAILLHIMYQMHTRIIVLLIDKTYLSAIEND